jgi:hypothetical protein
MWLPVGRQGLRIESEGLKIICHSRENGNPENTKRLGSCFRRNDKHLYLIQFMKPKGQGILWALLRSWQDIAVN